MTLVAAWGRCAWCWKGSAPGEPPDRLPVIDGELAFCSVECRDFHRYDPTKYMQRVAAYAGLGRRPVQPKAAPASSLVPRREP